MDIAVFGANGNIGQVVVREALDRGHRVTAALRSPYKMPRMGGGLTTVRCDVADAGSVADAVRGHDAVVSSIGGFGHDNPRIAIECAPAIVEGMSAAGVRRLVIVGTAGTLLGEDGTQRMDGAGFPAFLRGEATSHRELQAYLRTLDPSAIAWTYFSPPVTIEPGERTGSYALGADHLMVNAAGESYISNEDYAVALLDELERPQHVGRRFTAVSERG
jgi:uncharacterized protein